MNTTKYIIKVTYLPRFDKLNPHLYREVSCLLGKGGVFLNWSNCSFEECSKRHGYKDEKSAKRAISYLKNRDRDCNSDGLFERITYEAVAIEC